MRFRSDLVNDDVALPRLATIAGVVIGILLIGVRLLVTPFSYQSVLVTVGIGIIAVPISRFLIPIVLGAFLDRRDR